MPFVHLLAHPGRRSLSLIALLRNIFNSKPLTFYNVGLSCFYPGNGNTTVYFDAPRLRRSGTLRPMGAEFTHPGTIRDE